jgi:CO/xanthine dehydrogenase Mo-binding subunit
MLKKAGILIVAAVLGTGAAVGVAACGEDREGEVEFQTEGTGTAGTGTETAGTGTETAGTETAPETETEAETETAP